MYVAGVPAIVNRISFTGELGYEVYVAPHFQLKLYEEMEATGKEFNLNAALSANITYKILPSPNFEISNVILSTDSDKKFNEFAQIKKLKIYVSIRKLHSQKELEIKKIIFSETNFNINKNSFNYINDFFRKKSSSKKIIIKKSKIFFRKNLDKKDAIALSSIRKSNSLE